MIKIDASPLIYALKANLVPLLQKVYEKLIITETIYQEVIIKGKKEGYRDAFVADKLIETGEIIVHPDPGKELKLNLGYGESSVIASAIEERCPALIEDLRAMKAGLRLGIRIEFISLAILKAYQSSLITSEEFDDLLEVYCRVAGVSVVERHRIHLIKELLG
ncbi:MAG: hypothetical protein ACXAEI_09420 [Candidatus Hodarchaeales archaeon]|jgi:predicted nucleic acid-binding protein